VGVLLAGTAVPALPQSANLLRPYPDALASAGFEPGARFGNPPASGAGRTGFDSTNGRAKKRASNARNPKSGAASGPSAPARSLKPPPYSSRPGASAAPPPIHEGESETAALSRVVKPRREEIDAFDPLGLRLGTFIVKPAVEITGGYDTNPARTLTGKGARLLTLAPEVLVRSDWSRHEFRAELRGSTTRYEGMPTLTSKTVDLRALGRIDVSSRTRADLEARYLRATSAPGDPNTPAGVVSAPVSATTSAAAGLTHRFNRFEIALKGAAERVVYDPSELKSGAILDNTDRNVDQFGGTLRGSYELTPGIKPFVEIGRDRRVHDRQFDSLGLQRDSRGATFRAGTSFELSRKLTGEISAGYLDRRYKDPALRNLRGLIADASLIWNASALTTVTLIAKSTADETTLPGVSGILNREATVQVDHALRRWLIASAKFSYGVDVYEGAPREDKRMLASALLTYKMGRNVQVKVEARREWLRSNEPAQDYTANIFLAGLRFQL
jgi:hypothetical protein